MNLQEIKNNFCPYDENYCLAEDEVRWLIEQAEKAERYKKALLNTYIDGMTIEEILKESDKYAK